jgi:hypothetical protein
VVKDLTDCLQYISIVTSARDSNALLFYTHLAASLSSSLSSSFYGTPSEKEHPSSSSKKSSKEHSPKENPNEFSIESSSKEPSKEHCKEHSKIFSMDPCSKKPSSPSAVFCQNCEVVPAVLECLSGR